MSKQFIIVLLLLLFCLSCSPIVHAATCIEGWDAWIISGVKSSYQPGEIINAFAGYKANNPLNGQSLIQQIMIGIVDKDGKVIGEIVCVYNGSATICPAWTEGTKELSFKAPVAQGTYKLIAANDYGTSCEQAQPYFPYKSKRYKEIATIKVVIPLPSPTIVSFNANPVNIIKLRSSTLSWNVINATEVSISPNIGKVNPSGTITVKPAKDTTYTLTAINDAGITTTSQTTVNVVLSTATKSATTQNTDVGNSQKQSWFDIGDISIVFISIIFIFVILAMIKYHRQIIDFINYLTRIFTSEGKRNKLFTELCDAIKSFHYPRDVHDEIAYQSGLYFYLKPRFPSIKMEVRLRNGQGNIDLAVDDVGIEIKGHTTNSQLDKLPMQCGKYSADYNYIIVVLFMPDYSTDNFDRMKHMISKSYPQLIVEYITVQPNK